MTDLLIMRHGPTAWNAQRRIQGHTDIPLSEAGRVEVRRWRVPSDCAHFYCVASPLVRAMETARLLGFDPAPEAALREMSWGQWEGRTLDELRAQLGEVMSTNEARGLDFCPPGGESPRDTQDRLKPWLKSLSVPTLAVAHQGVIRALYALASGWDMRASPPVRLDKFAAHLFHVDGRGGAGIKRLNIDLRAA